MDKLEAAMSDYESFINKKYIYELSDKKNIDVTFKLENFPHVLGLHKIVDIKDLEKLNRNPIDGQKSISGKQVYKKLRNKEITSNMIFNSPHYTKIENRFNYFHKTKDLLFEKVIYDFDKSKVPSTIKGDLVLYTVKGGWYLQLFLVKCKQGYYVPMTFIVEDDDKYINEQTDHNIDKLSIIEKGKEILEYDYTKIDADKKEDTESKKDKDGKENSNAKDEVASADVNKDK